MGGGEMARRGGARGGLSPWSVIMGRQPHKNQFGGRPPEFPQQKIVPKTLVLRLLQLFGCSAGDPNGKFSK